MASKDAPFLLEGDTVNSHTMKTEHSSADSKDAISNISNLESPVAIDAHVLRRATIKLDMMIVPLAGLYCAYPVPRLLSPELSG